MDHKLVALLEEYNKRNQKIDFSDMFLPYQRKFFDHPSKLKAIVASRRSGKSYGAGIHAIEKSMEIPGHKTLIIGLSRQSIKRIFWKDILKKVIKKKNIECKPLETTLEMTFDNDSYICLLGMDSGPKDHEKALGQAFDLIIIDEASSFNNDLGGIIESTLSPTLIDRDGTLILISTPSIYCSGLFYEIACGLHPEYYSQKWSALDNPYVAANMFNKMKRLREKNPDVEKEAFYQIMYLGNYCHDLSAQVCKLTPLNYFVESPSNIDYVVIGVDIGYVDSDAISVIGWCRNSTQTYLIYEKIYEKQDVTSLAEKIREVEDIYEGKIVEKVMDAGALGKKIQAELENRHKLYYKAAEKNSKFEYIQLLNGSVATGDFKVRKEGIFCKDCKNLLWDKEDPRKWVISKHFHSDIFDSTLYAWRESLAYTEQPKDEELEQMDPDEAKEVEQYELYQQGCVEYDIDDDENYIY